jgi:hypothetical protein
VNRDDAAGFDTLATPLSAEQLPDAIKATGLAPRRSGATAR